MRRHAINNMNNISDLIAPCGINCGICMAYLRDKNKCPGCRKLGEENKISCLRCRIRNCILRRGDFCGDCSKFPCKDLEHLDKRYREKYRMSMINNLKLIEGIGLDEFVKVDSKKWACPVCGNNICVHNRKCYFCGKADH